MDTIIASYYFLSSQAGIRAMKWTSLSMDSSRELSLNFVGVERERWCSETAGQGGLPGTEDLWSIPKSSWSATNVSDAFCCLSNMSRVVGSKSF